ncbi:MAG: alginate lyase family protein [Woeseiaceae bacterium]|nr:alginate lyase family protein [Woeseiaceae bacterium]
MTKAGVESIRAELGNVPLFDATLANVKAEVDAEIELGIDTPIPKDFSGGYTHERHKRNFVILQKAGALYQILDDETYAVFVRDMLFQYEAIYKDLPLHPQKRSYARGKLFWQCLNDANWLLYVSLAYDAIYEWLSVDERKQLEANLFRPFADFLSVENPQFFNRVHNHSTWGNAAVGMIGLVMRDDELVNRALYGLEDDGLVAGARDDDGGLIKVEGQEVGFLANLEEPFSPDGYYTEGPYYQRYAMFPFLIFGQSLNNVRPELGILEYKDGVLMKGVGTLLNLADADGDFFPLNDAQKGMSYYTSSLVSAVNIAYHMDGNDPTLLSIAEKQGQVTLDDAGLAVAAGLRDGKAKPFVKRSVSLSDGRDGTEGGVAVLRHGNESLTLVFKYTAQGLSHGHYDKLSFSLYEHGDEVLQDYGMVRFVNIEQKGGGNYLPENTSWAKQTIAHNTLTQNGTSHFEGKYEIGSQHHSVLSFFAASSPDVQVVSAIEANAYPGTEMRRTMAMIKFREFQKPIVLDLFKVSSDRPHRYDLPFWYMGQIIDANFEYESPTELAALGSQNGYQHLYVEGSGQASSVSPQFQWMNKNRFYTLTSATRTDDELFFARLGANDPDFNLRRDAALILRRQNVSDTVFANIVEPHGSYSPVSELSDNPNSSVSELKVVFDDSRYTAVSMKDRQGRSYLFVVANKDVASDRTHSLKLDDQVLTWTGPYYLIDRSGD